MNIANELNKQQFQTGRTQSWLSNENPILSNHKKVKKEMKFWRLKNIVTNRKSFYFALG